MTFLRAVSAEFRKIRTTRLLWVLALILFGYVGFSAVAIAFFLSITPEEAGMPIADDFLAPLVYSMATATGYVFPIIFGAMSITSEVRHRTLGTVFLATPNRSVVLAAKAVAGLVIGAVYGVVALLGSVGLGAPVLAATGQMTLLNDPDTWLMLGRIVLAMALWGLVGVALGVLIPSQIGSIVTIIAFTQFVEPILRTAAAFADWLGEIAKFLPGAAGDALVGASFFAVFAGAGGGGTAPLEWWQGGIVLAGYAVLMGAIGAATTWRSDVT
ncbi:ABC transporter permease subunit [Pseudolysinimonas sp.]|uniref:ABC transporter permease subunit n=1 Tax=Pseudolysinimonas sp. TaxID=2680009 RepID=UPI00286A1D73|nr:ABC transporter permease subunit [Pseudolysinimonas sp.]